MPILINAYSTVTHPPIIDFPCERLYHRGLDDAELMKHLDGFIGYVMQAGDGLMNSRRYALYRHIQRVKLNLPLRLKKISSMNLPLGAGRQMPLYLCQMELFGILMGMYGNILMVIWI